MCWSARADQKRMLDLWSCMGITGSCELPLPDTIFLKQCLGGGAYYTHRFYKLLISGAKVWAEAGVKWEECLPSVHKAPGSVPSTPTPAMGVEPQFYFSPH